MAIHAYSERSSKCGLKYFLNSKANSIQDDIRDRVQEIIEKPSGDTGRAYPFDNNKKSSNSPTLPSGYPTNPAQTVMGRIRDEEQDLLLFRRVHVTLEPKKIGIIRAPKFGTETEQRLTRCAEHIHGYFRLAMYKQNEHLSFEECYRNAYMLCLDKQKYRLFEVIEQNLAHCAREVANDMIRPQVEIVGRINVAGIGGTSNLRLQLIAIAIKFKKFLTGCCDIFSYMVGLQEPEKST